MLDVLAYPADVLDRPAALVETFDADLRSLVDQMAEAMYVAGGVGLAAPQVGVSRRLLLIDPSGGEEANKLVPMINPRVIWRSTETEAGEEGCLSLPGVRLQVPRSIAVQVDYYDVEGKLQKWLHKGFSARIVQHEIDHLDGVMMLDRVGNLERRLALKDLGKIR